MQWGISCSQMLTKKLHVILEQKAVSRTKLSLLHQNQVTQYGISWQSNTNKWNCMSSLSKRQSVIQNYCHCYIKIKILRAGYQETSFNNRCVKMIQMFLNLPHHAKCKSPTIWIFVFWTHENRKSAATQSPTLITVNTATHTDIRFWNVSFDKKSQIMQSPKTSLESNSNTVLHSSSPEWLLPLITSDRIPSTGGQIWCLTTMKKAVCALRATQGLAYTHVHCQVFNKSAAIFKRMLLIHLS